MANTWRWDKTDPVDTIRGRLNVAWLAADLGVVVGVGFNASGKLVKGAGNTGVIGVVILTRALAAGHPVDVIKRGEALGGTEVIVGTAAAAGTSYSISAAGVVTATAAGVRGTLGFTVEVDRLVVDFQNAL